MPHGFMLGPVCTHSQSIMGDMLRAIYRSIYLSVNTYIHTYVRTYIHTYIRTYIHKYIQLVKYHAAVSDQGQYPGLEFTVYGDCIDTLQ